MKKAITGPCTASSSASLAVLSLCRGSSEMVQYTGVSVTEDAPPATSIHHHHHHRAVLKNGNCNLYPSHVSQHKWRFIQDTVTTVVDMRWRYALALCTLVFFCSWTAFAVLWWLIAYVHGDFETANQVSLCGLLNKRAQFMSVNTFTWLQTDFHIKRLRNC